MNSKDNSSNEEILKLVYLNKELIEVANKQKSLIEDVIEINELLNKTIKIKDEIIDKQLQILQLLELKLKEFGYELGDAV